VSPGLFQHYYYENHIRTSTSRDTPNPLKGANYSKILPDGIPYTTFNLGGENACGPSEEGPTATEIGIL
jgi:hypothetical protein